MLGRWWCVSWRLPQTNQVLDIVRRHKSTRNKKHLQSTENICSNHWPAATVSDLAS
uniref:Uncharacterized protein n=1 Tax=Anguilla anguilla TaxID=7936 RepID=A0A0E9Q4J8_ANGAN